MFIRRIYMYWHLLYICEKLNKNLFFSSLYHLPPSLYVMFMFIIKTRASSSIAAVYYKYPPLLKHAANVFIIARHWKVPLFRIVSFIKWPSKRLQILSYFGIWKTLNLSMVFHFPYSKNMTNFKDFAWIISWCINLQFLKSATYNIYSNSFSWINISNSMNLFIFPNLNANHNTKSKIKNIYTKGNVYNN